MMTEASTFKIKALRNQLTDLQQQRSFKEMSDGMAYTNGSMKEFDKQIAEVKSLMKVWYFSNPHWFASSSDDAKVTFSSNDGGINFDIEVVDMSRPGVMKKIGLKVNRREMDALVDYLGGRPVNYLGQSMDSVSAYSSIEPRFKAVSLENERLKREVNLLRNTLLNLENGAND